MYKILFVHDFLSSPLDPFTTALIERLKGVKVLVPVLPINPYQAMLKVQHIYEDEQPDLIVGWGSGCILAQQFTLEKRILINPVCQVSSVLSEYLYSRNVTPRPADLGYANRVSDLVLSSTVIESWMEMESQQFLKSKNREEICHVLFWMDKNTDNAVRYQRYYPSLTYVPGFDFLDKSSLKGIAGLIQVVLEGDD